VWREWQAEVRLWKGGDSTSDWSGHGICHFWINVHGNKSGLVEVYSETCGHGEIVGIDLRVRMEEGSPLARIKVSSAHSKTGHGSCGSIG
jgi:hypothetical protein